MSREHLRGFQHSHSGSREIAASSGSGGGSGFARAVEDDELRYFSEQGASGATAAMRYSSAAEHFEHRHKAGRITTYALLSQDEDLVVPQVEHGADQLTRHGQVLLNSWCFQGLVAVLIVTNAMVIGFETDKPEAVQWDVIEQALLMFFSIELLLRMYVLGLSRFFHFYTSDFVWNMFDLVIVSLGIFDTICEVVLNAEQIPISNGCPTLLRMVRLLRILRIFRLIRFLKRLYILAYGFSLAAVAVFWVACLMTGLLYFCAIILVRTVGRLPEGDSDKEFFFERFGTIGQAMFSLFQLAVQPNLLEYQEQTADRPFLLCFLVVFVIFGSFGMIALLTGVISEAMFEKNIMRLEDERKERESVRKTMVKACTDMFNSLDRNESDECPIQELFNLIPKISSLFEEHNVQYTRHDLHAMIELMDTDGSGAINRAEFCRGILQVAEEVRPMLIMELHYDSLAYFRGQIEACVEHIKHEQEDIKQFRDFVVHGFRDLRRQLAEDCHAASSRRVSRSSCSPDETTAEFRVQDGNDANSQNKYVMSVLGQMTGELKDLQSAVYSLSGHIKELIGGEQIASVAKQLDQLTMRRQAEANNVLFETVDPGAWGSQVLTKSDRAFPSGHAENVGTELKLFREEITSLQGAIFSLSGRVEEVVADSGADKYNSQLQELAMLREKSENESIVASRIGKCEFAVLQASGAIRQLEDRIRELIHQVEALLQSYEERVEPPGGCGVLSRSGSKDSKQTRSEFCLHRSPSGGSHIPLPVLAEGNHITMDNSRVRDDFLRSIG